MRNLFVISSIILMLLLSAHASTAQNRIISRVIENQLEQHLPHVIDDVLGLDNLDISNIKIRPRAFKVHGNAAVKIKTNKKKKKEQVRAQPLYFKAKVFRKRAQRNKVGGLKINLGRTFLGLRAYRKVF